MSFPSLGFIGGGRVARILIGGWRHAEIELSNIVVCEPDDAAFAALEGAVQGTKLVRGSATDVARQAVVFLAVHPPQLMAAAASLVAALQADALVVSLAPKFTLTDLQASLGGNHRLVRLIPNAPSLICQGFNPVAWGDALSDRDRQVVRELLTPLGELPEVAEATLEAYAIIAAMGPTYFWPQWLELESIAVEFGLPPADARHAIWAMTVGAIDLLTSSQGTPEEVVDLIPVRPLADFGPQLRQAYRSRLTALFEKIRPRVSQEPRP